MNPKQRIYAQIQHQETEPVPYTLPFETPELMEALDQYYGETTWREELQNHILEVPLPHPLLGIPGERTGETALLMDLFGARWAMHKRPAHLEKPPLQDPSLEGYTFPDISDCFMPDWENQVSAFVAQHPDHFIVASPGFGIFERTWVLRGFENMLADVITEPKFYESLVTAITDHQLALLDRMLAAPLDGILFSDDWGYQDGVLIGAKRWRRFIKPNLKRLYDRVHQAGKIALNHVCGSVREIMPDIIEIGLDVLESVQPEAAGMNPYELKAEFGSAITFWGGLGSQSIIPYGSPADIKLEVSRLVREMGAGGGYILAPAKGVQPETPVENMAALVESFTNQRCLS
ncbi:MAG: uroporphyrinogen decarboxylase family protein [Brevefilum sp.]